MGEATWSSGATLGGEVETLAFREREREDDFLL